MRQHCDKTSPWFTVALAASLLVCAMTSVMVYLRTPTHFTGPADAWKTYDPRAEKLQRQGIPADFVHPTFSNGLAIYGIRDTSNLAYSKQGYINTRYEVVIPARFDLAWDFDESGYALIQIGTGMGLIDRTGHEVIPTTLGIRNLCMPDITGTCFAQNDLGKWGAIDLNAKWLVEPMYESREEVVAILRTENGTGPNAINLSDRRLDADDGENDEARNDP